MAAIAGYVYNADNELCTVVAFINHPEAKGSLARPILDALIDWASRARVASVAAAIAVPAPLSWWQHWWAPAPTLTR